MASVCHLEFKNVQSVVIDVPVYICIQSFIKIL